MMVDRVDIEVDNLMTNQVDGKRISKTMKWRGSVELICVFNFMVLSLQQDLLKHMMVDRVDIEVDNLMTNQVDGKRISKLQSNLS